MKLVLGSKSPRRQDLLREMGYTFDVRVKETDENYPAYLKKEDVALYIAKQKALALLDTLTEGEVLICADTIVCINDEILGKPVDRVDAISMLSKLSGKKHEVITAVCVVYQGQLISDYSSTEVYVKDLTPDEIAHYIDTYQPYDKAGAYGIQEWFGAVAIDQIIGSYNNVVGLPTHLVYKMLIQHS